MSSLAKLLLVSLHSFPALGFLKIHFILISFQCAIASRAAYSVYVMQYARKGTRGKRYSYLISTFSNLDG